MLARITSIVPQNLRNIDFHAGGWLSVALVVTITFALLLTFGRVISNAKNNYEVYLYEKEGLAALLQQNEVLQDELAYYRSYEYKKLYARDYLHMAESGERLYRILGENTYYSVETETADFFTEGNYVQWWQLLL